MLKAEHCSSSFAIIAMLLYWIHDVFVPPAEVVYAMRAAVLAVLAYTGELRVSICTCVLVVATQVNQRGG
jgi:hypothetical protein